MSKKLIYWWMSLITLCFIAYWIQINTYLYADSALMLHMAGLMLKGQTYGHYIFEENPPLIFYLHMPPIIISKMTGIKIVYCFPLYVITLTLLSAVCSQHLFNKLFKHNGWLVYLMSCALVFILLFLPSNAFGQREHFLLVLTIPYILLAACRLENITINKSFSILVGIMAGIGFAIKPFFLLTLLFIELLFVCRLKSLLGWLRIESVIAFLFILFYGFAVILFFPAYWHIVLPLWMPFWSSTAQSWWLLLTYPYFLFCCVTLGFFCMTQKNEPNATIKVVFSLAVIGYLISFLIPRLVWYYHILPAFSISFLYFVLIFGELVDKTMEPAARGLNWAWVALLGIAVFFRPVMASFLATVSSIAYFHSNNPMNQLATFLEQHEPKNSFDFFGISLKFYQLEYYTTANYTGRLSHFIWEYNRLSPSRYSLADRQKTLSYVLPIISDTLDHKKPRFVIVDIQSSQAILNQRIDYTKEYTSNQQFRHAWSHYTYLTKIGPYDVYQRKHEQKEKVLEI
jgi:hypothetical protein